jgi:hypothetical protein
MKFQIQYACLRFMALPPHPPLLLIELSQPAPHALAHDPFVLAGLSNGSESNRACEMSVASVEIQRKYIIHKKVGHAYSSGLTTFSLFMIYYYPNPMRIEL